MARCVQGCCPLPDARHRRRLAAYQSRAEVDKQLREQGGQNYDSMDLEPTIYSNDLAVGLESSYLACGAEANCQSR